MMFLSGFIMAIFDKATEFKTSHIFTKRLNGVDEYIAKRVDGPFI